MFLHGHFVALLVANLSSGNICFMAQKHDLDIRICLFSDVLQPVAYMFEGTSLGNVIYQDHSIHLAIVAG